MSKIMAKTSNHIVQYFIYCDDDFKETEEYINVSGIDVQVGDQYINGSFYRDGERILSEEDLNSLQSELLLSSIYNIIKEEVYE